MTIKTHFLIAAILAVPHAAWAQNPPAIPAAAAAAPTEVAAPAPFVYEADGRRDPFVSPSESGAAPIQRGAGVAGLIVNDISVRGIMASHGALLAMIKGPDNRTYIVRSGDRLADGVVTSVIPQGLILLQDSRDPLARHKQQEIRKLLRSPEGAKE